MDDFDFFSVRPDILIHPNIPKTMHGVNPRSVMGQAWWDKQRRIAYHNADYRCMACGVKKQDAKYHQWLEAHEIYEMDYDNGRMIFKEIVALCHSCHNYIHDGRMMMLLDKGEMPQEKYDDIIEHGDKILTDNKLEMKEPPMTCAAWGDWRMVMGDKEYPGKFKNYNEWLAHKW